MKKLSIRSINHYKYKKGLSILEVVLLLLVIAVMLITSVFYFRQAERQAQIVAFFGEMNGVIQATNDYYEQNGSFTGFSTLDIVKANTIVPRYNVLLANADGSGSRVIVPWSGARQAGNPPGIVPYRVYASSIEFRLYATPSYACQQVVEQLAQFSDIIGVSSASDLKNYCLERNSGSMITISFTYPKQNK